MASTLKDRVKNALRISVGTTAFDDEVDDLIAAAKTDLFETGIMLDETDPLVERAIITYCKANFGWNNPDMEKLVESYQSQLKKMTLVQDYTAEANGGEQNALE